MSATINQLDAIKGRQQQMWASGDYAGVGARIHPIAEHLCDAADLIAGTQVLDVATGSGNAALAAADYGPTERAAAGLDDDGRAALRVDLAALAAAASRLPAGGPVAIDATYLEAIAVRA
jgi:predicted nicotinamide N-methyase